MKKMQLNKRLLSLVLAMALCLSLMGGMVLGAGAEEEASYHSVGNELYLPLNDLTGAAAYNGSIAQNFADGDYGCDGRNNKVMLLTAEGDYVEYSFDLTDDVTTASLKLLIQGGKVEVKPQGGSYTTLTATNGSGFYRGAAIYTLNESNALSGADKKFTVRISYADGTTILNGLLVQTRLDAIDSAYTMAAIGQTYLRSLYDVSAGVRRYFDNGGTDNSTPALWFTAGGQYVTLRYKVTQTAEYATLDYVNLGNALTCEISTDNQSWTAVASGARVAHKDFYVRFTANSGDTFLKSVTVTPRITTWQKVDGEFYLPLNDLTGAADHSGSRPYENYNETYYGGTAATNLTMLLQNPGEYVEYNFDLADNVTSASLKLSISNGLVEVKPQGGSYTTLTAKNGTGFNRSAAIYALDESNALSGVEKKFTVRISYAGGTTILNGLLVQTGEPILEKAHTIGMLGQDYLSALYDQTAGIERYFLNGNVPTLWMNPGEQATFHFAVSQEAEGAIISFAQAGSLTAEISADGTAWTAISSGTQVEHKNFYVRLTAAAGDAFLQSVTVTPKITTWMPVDGELYLPLDSLDYASDYAGSIQGYNDQHSDGVLATNNVILLTAEGTYVEHRFDLSDDVSAATLKLLISGGKVEVKPDGGAFKELTAKNGSGFNRGAAIYTLDETNALAADSNKFILRISYAGGTTILNGLMIQTGVEVTSDICTTEALGQTYLQDLYDVSAGATRYFLNQSVPTVHLRTGEYVTFYYEVPQTTSATAVNFAAAGNPLTAEVSTDGAEWTAIESGDKVSGTAFYVRFTANTAEAFLTTVTVNPVATIASANLTLGDILDLNISVDGDAADKYELRATIGGDAEYQTIQSENGKYTVKLPAHRMQETVKLELLFEGVIIDKQIWTLEAYNSALRQDNASDTAMLNLLDTLENYGAYAAYYAAPSETAPDIGAVEAVTRNDLANYKLELKTGNAALQPVTALYLDDACDLMVKFDAAAWAGNTLYIDGNAVEVSETDGKVIYTISELLPQDWSKMYNIKAVNAAGETVFEVDYNVLSYAYIQLGKAEETLAGLNGLMKAMYLYSEAAVEYQS